MNETTPVENITSLPTPAPKKTWKRNLAIAGAVTAVVVVAVVVHKKSSKKSLAEEIGEAINETIENIAA